MLFTLAASPDVREANFILCLDQELARGDSDSGGQPAGVQSEGRFPAGSDVYFDTPCGDRPGTCSGLATLGRISYVRLSPSSNACIQAMPSARLISPHCSASASHLRRVKKGDGEFVVLRPLVLFPTADALAVRPQCIQDVRE